MEPEEFAAPLPDDEGPVNCNIYVQGDQVCIGFARSIAWLGFDVAGARAFLGELERAVEILEAAKGLRPASDAEALLG